MKNSHEYEVISSFLDGEYAPGEKESIEEKINASPGLKNKLAEYTKLHDLTSKVNKIPESPYFEAKLFEKLKEKRKNYSSVFTKYYPAFGLAVMTLALMFIFKFNTKEISTIIEKQKLNIMDIYAKNLQPILYTADVTKEDIFNFAFFNKLPIDKENHQYLSLGTEGNGNGYFEIKTASFFPETNNLEKFMSSLKLNPHERKQVDSILEGYVAEIKPQILANDKNTIAINSNLWNLNKAIAADLIQFAKSVNNPALDEIIPAAYKFAQTPAIAQMIKNVKNNNGNETYIFITPDTIFSEQFRFDMDEFAKEFGKIHKDLDGIPNQFGSKGSADFNKKLNKDAIAHLNKELLKLKKLNKLNFDNKKFQAYFDSNYCKIQIPKIELPDFELPDFDSIAAHIEDATKQFRNFSYNYNFSFSFPNADKGQKYKSKADSLRMNKFKMKLPMIGPDLLMEMQKLDTLKKSQLKNYAFYGDSLGRFFNNMFADSGNGYNPSNGYNPGNGYNPSNGYNPKELNEQMRIMKEQFKMFQKEMERMKEEMQNIKPEKKEKKKKTPVEIGSKRYYYFSTKPIIV